MEGTKRKPQAAAGSGVSEGTHLYCLDNRIKLIFLSLHVSSLTLTHKQTHFTAQITPFPVTDINTHSDKLFLLVLSYYLTEHQQIFAHCQAVSGVNG